MIQPDALQWRAIFDRVDSLMALPPEAREDAINLMRCTDDASDAVNQVVRDWHERTRADTAMQGDSAAQVAQSLLALGSVHEGQRCGNYRLLQPIGQGGMGSVWRAERSDGLYQSKVAVKLLGSLALSPHARARFAHEGELLARLTHPNIARLLDAGLTADFQRFLVLELVEGRDIVAHVVGATDAPMKSSDIVLLFRQVLSAVAFAHGQLIVHRDIKPSNVMVTASNQVKLLDFGVGKLLDDGGSNHGLTQAVGAAFTHAYAAPEQLRGDPVSTAVDVFALGTLLCELLTGARPKWSVAKGSLQPGDQPLGLDAITDADLRAIVGKALAVDATDRYNTVAAFDEDLNRYLSHEPVRARASTRWYQLRKFLSRNKFPVFAAAAAGLAIVGSLGIAIWQLQEAREGRSQALQEASRANQVTAFVTSLFRASDLRTPSAQDKRSMTALQLLESGRERLKSELDDQPETKVALLAVLAEVYGILGDDTQFATLNEERIRFATARLGPLHPATLNGRMTDAESDLYSGRFDAARDTLTSLEAPFKIAFGEKSERFAALLATRADLERRAAREDIEHVLSRFVRALALFADIKSQTEDAAVALQNYSTALASAGRYEQALEAGSRAIKLMESLKEYDHAGLAIAYDRHADVLQKLGRHEGVEKDFDKALLLLRESYGTSATLYLNTLLSKARWLHSQARRSEAWSLVNQVFATERQPSSDTHGVSEQYYVRGLLLLAERRFAEAQADLLRAVNGWRTAGNHPLRLRAAETALAQAQSAAARP